MPAIPTTAKEPTQSKEMKILIYLTTHILSPFPTALAVYCIFCSVNTHCILRQTDLLIHTYLFKDPHPYPFISSVPRIPSYIIQHPASIEHTYLFINRHRHSALSKDFNYLSSITFLRSSCTNQASLVAFLRELIESKVTFPVPSSVLTPPWLKQS